MHFQSRTETGLPLFDFFLPTLRPRSADDVDCYVSGSESDDSYDSPVDCLRFFTFGCDFLLCLFIP